LFAITLIIPTELPNTLWMRASQLLQWIALFFANKSICVGLILFHQLVFFLKYYDNNLVFKENFNILKSASVRDNFLVSIDNLDFCGIILHFKR
jgi:hypothetical protein